MTSWPNYCNDAKVWLPMTSAAHDAGNVRTLDVSGNGLHYRFGDGSTAGTFPTKLSGQRGYQFDGSNDYLEALTNHVPALDEGTWAAFFQSGPELTSHVWSHWDGGANFRSILRQDAGSFRFLVGSTGVSVSVPRNGLLNFAAGRRTTDGFRHLYVDGISDSSNAGTNTIPSSTAALRIGNNYNSSAPLKARIFWYGHWEYALTELQLRDLEARLRREYNNV